MAQSNSLRLVSFNCRGWNSGRYLIHDISHLFDFCFVQEHWLFDSQLGLLNFSPDFSSFGVSGMDDSILLGRPYGGCAILYRKSLAPFVSHLPFPSKRFCALKVSFNDVSFLCICVYFPTDYHDINSRDAFVQLLGEIEGFIDSITFDHLVIGGDFNVDLSVPSIRASCLSDFLSDKALICVDHLPASSIEYTFFSDANNSTSWLDHFFCDSTLASLTMSVSPLLYGSNLSDHIPISIVFDICPSSLPVKSPQIPNTHSHSTNWAQVDNYNIEQFLASIVSNLPVLPDEVFYCCNPHCKVHSADISQYLTSFLNCISVAACNALPSIPSTVRKHKIPGWNDAAKDLRDKANFWYRVWLEAGSPSAGVLAVIKKKSKSRYKYEVRRLKRRREHIAREKLAKAFSIRNKKDFWQNVKKFRSTSQASSHHRIDGVIDDKATSELFRDKLSITLNKHACHSFNSGSLGQSLDNPIFSAFSFETVLDTIQHLKRDKKDDSSLVSNHFIIAAPVIAEPLANFFSVLLRHGFLPAQLVNCVLVPIPKPGKNPSSSDSYRPIALASTLIVRSLSGVSYWITLTF